MPTWHEGRPMVSLCYMMSGVTKLWVLTSVPLRFLLPWADPKLFWICAKDTCVIWVYLLSWAQRN